MRGGGGEYDAGLEEKVRGLGVGSPRLIRSRGQGIPEGIGYLRDPGVDMIRWGGQ